MLLLRQLRGRTQQQALAHKRCLLTMQQARAAGNDIVV
jgi:hypothetical protein